MILLEKGITFDTIWAEKETLHFENTHFEENLTALFRDEYAPKSDTADYDDNKILRQEREEEKRRREHDPNANRFLTPYYDKYYAQIAVGQLPSFLRTTRVLSATKFQNGKKPEMEAEFNAFTQEEKQQTHLALLKELAIIYARKANLANREKYTNVNAMSKKDAAMENFMLYATKYNAQVPPREQIHFCISNDVVKGPLLDASVPGFTRLSVHFGSEENLIRTLKNVSFTLEQEGMQSPYRKNRFAEINVDEVYSQGVNLNRYEVFETGLLTRNYSRSAKKCIEQIKEMDSSKLKCFACFVYPELNDREISYLAEMAGIGESELIRLEGILRGRAKQKDPQKRRTAYLQGFLLGAKEQDIPKKLGETFDLYMMGEAVFEENVNLSAYIGILQESGVNENHIREFCEQTVNRVFTKEQGNAFTAYMLKEDEEGLPILDREAFCPVFQRVDMETKLRILGNLLKERDAGLDLSSIKMEEITENELGFLHAIQETHLDNVSFIKEMVEPLLKIKDGVVPGEEEALLEEAYTAYQLLVEDSNDSISEKAMAAQFHTLLVEAEVEEELIQTFVSTYDMDETHSNVYKSLRDDVVPEVLVEARKEVEGAEVRAISSQQREERLSEEKGKNGKKSR